MSYSFLVSIFLQYKIAQLLSKSFQRSDAELEIIFTPGH